jgi:hypothetical protein
VGILTWIDAAPTGGNHLADGGYAFAALRLDTQRAIERGDGASGGTCMRAGLAVVNGVADTDVHACNTRFLQDLVDYENDYQFLPRMQGLSPLIGNFIENSGAFPTSDY